MRLGLGVAVAGVIGALAACPDRPSCVSSQAPPGRHAIEGFELVAGGSLEALVEWIAGASGARLESQSASRAHFVFRSRVLGFKDDLELLVEDRLVAVRSCSRVGYWDLGANRRRVEGLRRGLRRAGLIQ